MAGALALQHEAELTVAEVAELKGCGVRYVQQLVAAGDLPAVQRLNERKRPIYYIPLSALDAKLQMRYLKTHGLAPEKYPNDMTEDKVKETPHRPLDSFSLHEREQIAFWTDVVEDWEQRRYSSGMPLGKADEEFIQYALVEYRERHSQLMGRAMRLSRPTLHRYHSALKEGNLEGLVDKRGQSTRGTSKIPQKVWDAFLYYYLDPGELAVTTCVEKVHDWAFETHKELLAQIPSESSFRRKLDRDVPESLQVLGRKGEKAHRDRYAPYIRREYDQMESNDYWVADTHTLDVISNDKDGKHHRLYLVAFFDARSGIFTGCYVADQPSSQATLYALRKAILRYGIPKNIYVDNGHEFLTFDVGGLGHRTRKSQEGKFQPPPIFQRLGITMINAIVRNARAKVIERRFLDVKKQLSSLFPTYTGGNVVERPEVLKYNLKAGKAVADQELIETVELLMHHYFNEQPYGGAVVKDRGKRRMQVYHENLHEKRVPKKSQEDVLNLMLMRSSRPQTVGRRGVYFKVGDTQYDYWNEDFVHAMQGEKVYYRYDPADMSHVRVYDLKDRYLTTVAVDNKTVLAQGCSVEELKEANKKIRHFEKTQKQLLDNLTSAIEDPLSKLELAKRRAQRNMNLEYLPNANMTITEIGEDETGLLDQAVGGYEISDTMLENAKKHYGYEGSQDDE